MSWQVRACNAGDECSDWSAMIPVLVSQREGGGGGDYPPLTPDCQPEAPAGHSRSGSGGGGSAHTLDPHTVADGGTGALIVTIGYNAAGYAKTLTRDSDGTVYGTIRTMDAWGHATEVDEAEGATITRGYSQVTGLALNLTAVKGDDTMLAEYTYDFDAENLDDRTLFLNARGERFRVHQLSDKVRAYLAAAGVEKPGTCHLLRHTMATLMLENGADIRFIQAMLGHASLETTTIYTQVSIRALKEVYARTHPAKHVPRGRQVEDDEADAPTEAELLAGLAAEIAEEKP